MSYQFTPIRGFINTPVSKSICIFTTVVALAASIFEVKYYFNLQIDPFIIEFNQYWRIVLFQLSVANESDCLIVILLWFMYKNLERFYGSRKYLSLVTVFALYNALLCFLVMCLGQIFTRFVTYIIAAKLGWISHPESFDEMIFNRVIPGPLGIIASLYVCYGNCIPVSYRFNIVLSPPSSPALPEGSQEELSVEQQQASSSSDSDAAVAAAAAAQQPRSSSTSRELTLTNHLQIHVLFTLLFLNNGFLSIIPCTVGLFLGKLYVNDLLPGAKWLLPNSVFRFFIHPVSTITKVQDAVQSSLSGGYDRLSGSHTSESLAGSQILDDENDDQLDELRSNNSHEIRAETPVRPLGSQFLDTFRT